MSATAELSDYGVSEKRTDLPERELEKAYFSRSRSGRDDAEKQPQRDRLFTFLLRHHRSKKMRFFGMPGAKWQFENMLHHELRKRVSFVGIERSWQILEYSLRHMPGRRKEYLVEQLASGELYGFESVAARVVQCDFNDWMHIRGFERAACRSEAGRWIETYRNWTAIWIDAFSPLGSRMLNSLWRVPKHCDPLPSQIPIAVTFLYGRDAPRAFERYTGEPLSIRVQAISDAINASGLIDPRDSRSKIDRVRWFDPHDAWFYMSSGDCRMATVCGVLHRGPWPNLADSEERESLLYRLGINGR